MNQGQPDNMLDRRRLVDPEMWKPRFYSIDITCQDTAGATAGGAVTLDNAPFILDTVTHTILGNPPDIQDGQYLVSMRDDQAVYMQRPVTAQAAFGGVYNGASVIPLPVRCAFRGSATISIDVVNLFDRGYLPGVFVVQFVLIGFEKWSR